MGHEFVVTQTAYMLGVYCGDAKGEILRFFALLRMTSVKSATPPQTMVLFKMGHPEGSGSGMGERSSRGLDTPPLELSYFAAEFSRAQQDSLRPQRHLESAAAVGLRSA